jgi:hypothetical protein
MPWLTLIGTASIQDYLFRTNKLKENLGGSYLAATAIREFGTGRELVFEGGGNAAVLFDSREKAEQAVYSWSRHWLDEAPGLRLVAAHVPYQEGDLAQAYPEALKRLFANENRPPFGSPLGALPVVRACSSTGLAADTLYKGEWLNEESKRKQEIADKDANNDFITRYRECLIVGGRQLRFAFDFEDLGQREGASHIAVVHVDGNGVGQVFQDIANDDEADEREFKRRMKAASEAIRQITRDALAATLRDLSKALPDLEKQGIYLKSGYYPVRPLVDEGDELTAVCQGKAGLLFTALYLQHAEKEASKHTVALGRRLTFCAGVVIVGQRFPFSRAYRLAEELTSSAKRRRKLFPQDDGSWLDFEVVREGSDSSLDELRSQYLRTIVDDTGAERDFSC